LIATTRTTTRSPSLALVVYEEASMEKQVRLSEIKFGPIRHPVLSDAFIERIKAFKKVLSEFDTVSPEQTIDNFKRDTNPESELIIWERIANTFETYLSHNPTTGTTVRKEIFAVLLSASMGTEEFENIKHLSDQQIKHLIHSYKGLSTSS
jgi:hypothetical protein